MSSVTRATSGGAQQKPCRPMMLGWAPSRASSRSSDLTCVAGRGGVARGQGRGASCVHVSGCTPDAGGGATVTSSATTIPSAMAAAAHTMALPSSRAEGV